MRAAILLIALAACRSAPIAPSADLSGADLAFVCPTDRIAFPMGGGCGSVYGDGLCLPNDPATLGAASAVAPGLSCGGTGYASPHCTDGQVQCVFASWLFCDGSRLGDEGWNAVCRLATLLQPGQQIAPIVTE